MLKNSDANDYFYCLCDVRRLLNHARVVEDKEEVLAAVGTAVLALDDILRHLSLNGADDFFDYFTKGESILK